MSMLYLKGTNKTSAVLRSFRDVVLSHQPSLLLTANTFLREKCYHRWWTALVKGVVHSVRLSLRTNLTVVVIPSSRDEWLKSERNYSFAITCKRIWIGCMQVLENA